MTMVETQRRRSIDRIVRDYRQRLLSFIRWLAPTRADAEDILQDVLYQFTVSFDDIRSLEDVAAWLFRVARNRVTDLARKPSLGRRWDPASGEESYLLEELLPDPSANPERQFMQGEMAQAIEAALEALPAPQRDVFIWHELQGMSFNEMADLTGEPLSTLLSRKRYAVLALRARLKDLKSDQV